MPREQARGHKRPRRAGENDLIIGGKCRDNHAGKYEIDREC